MTPAAANERKPAKRRTARSKPKPRNQTPAATRIPKNARESFLELIRAGKTRHDAAEAVGYTGTKFRSLARNDQEFASAYAAARAVGQREREDWLRDAVWVQAERGERWALEMLAKATLPETDYLRERSPTTHVEMTGPAEVHQHAHLHVHEQPARELAERVGRVIDLDAFRVAAPAGAELTADTG